MTVDELLEGVRAELAIKLFGDDLEVLREKADEIARVVDSVAGAADVQVDQVSGAPQLLVRVDRQAIARYGINVADVQKVVRAAVGGQSVGQLFEGTRRFDILVRFAPQFRGSREAISQILVQSPQGLQVPLSQLARIEEVVGPRQITREKSQRFITVQCNVTDRDIGSFVAEAQGAIEARVALPPGLPGDLGRPVPPATGSQQTAGHRRSHHSLRALPVVVLQLQLAEERGPSSCSTSPWPWWAAWWPCG